MKLYKLWELPSPCTVVIGQNAFAFTTMAELIKAFTNAGTEKMVSIIEQSNFVEQDDGAFKKLPYHGRKPK